MRNFDQISPSEADNILNAFDPEKFLHILRKSLFWVLAFFVITVSTAYLYVRYTKPLYESVSVIKLNFESEAKALGLANMETSDLSEISGEIELIRSKLFFARVIDLVDLNVSYYYYGRYLEDERYGNSPFKVDYQLKNGSVYDLPFDIEIQSASQFKMTYQKGATNLSKTYQFGERIGNDDFEFIIRKTSYFDYPEVQGRYYFTINSREALIDYFEENVTVRPENFNAKTIRISLTDYNKFKARDLVMAIDTLYLGYTKLTKNQALEQKIIFLNTQIAETESKLESFEDYFEQFTISNRTTDLGRDIEKTIDVLNELDSSRFELNMQLSALKKLGSYMEAGTYELINPVLLLHLPTSLHKTLTELQELIQERDVKLSSYNDNTQVVQQLDQKTEVVVDMLQSMLGDYQTLVNNELRRIESTRRYLEKNFVSLPAMETDYQKNKRLYALQEAFLLSLRQSKMDLEITKAGTVTNFVILAPASLANNPIKPERNLIYGFGVMFGLIASLLFVSIRYLFHNKINSLRELERLIDIPILGTIPKYTATKLLLTKLIVRPNSKSAISEALRAIRTNMQFLSGDDDARIITITSTVSGEGKTFVAVNLGAVIAFSNQKVCIVDLDMRKPKVHIAFESDPKTVGMSTMLIGKSTVEECVCHSDIAGLDYIPAGPNPPNPSELILNPQYDQILDELKRKYDVVILDSPPVGLVTDATLSMRKSDLQLYVIRADYSRRTYLKSIENLKRLNQFPHLTLIFNGMDISSKGYGQGYGYGYGYYEDSKKS